MDAEDRTSALGLFNTARSFWRSAEQLRMAPPKVTHPGAPQNMLYSQAIELYLKAHLRGTGRSVAELKKFSHRVHDTALAAATAGLNLSAEQMALLGHIQETDFFIEARYIVTGFKQLPTTDALSELTQALDKEVCTALADLKVPVRLEAFEEPQPARNDELDGDAHRVLAHLFKTSDVQMRDVGWMAHHLDFDQGMLEHVPIICTHSLRAGSS